MHHTRKSMLFSSKCNIGAIRDFEAIEFICVMIINDPINDSRERIVIRVNIVTQGWDVTHVNLDMSFPGKIMKASPSVPYFYAARKKEYLNDTIELI
jgi:hypothetical protein